MNIQGLKAHISHRVFELAKEVFGLTDGKNSTEHNQGCILPGCDSDEDGFRFNPKTKTFHCRKCKFGGDIIELSKKVFSDSFAQAHDRIAQASGYIHANTPQQKTSAGNKPVSALDTFHLDAVSPVYKATAKHRPDILFDDYQRAGAKLFRNARFKEGYKNGIAIPMYGVDYILSGWCCYCTCGLKKLAMGSKSGIVGNDAIFNVRTAKQAKVVFKTAGVSDYLVLSGTIERLGVESDYYAFTNGAGEGEEPGKFEALLRPALTGLSVGVIQDNDEAGESGALRWAESIAEYAADVRIVRLPSVIFDCPVKDLRDFFAIGR